MEKKTKKVLKKHFHYCLRHKNFRATIIVNNDIVRLFVIDYVNFLRNYYDGNVLKTSSNKTEYIINFRNGSTLIVVPPIEGRLFSRRHNSVVIDEQVPELFRNNIIYPGLCPRLIFVPFWLERIIKTIDSSKTYPHAAKTTSLKRYVDIIPFN